MMVPLLQEQIISVNYTFCLRGGTAELQDSLALEQMGRTYGLNTEADHKGRIWG